jgi:hypothetical protein
MSASNEPMRSTSWRSAFGSSATFERFEPALEVVDASVQAKPGFHPGRQRASCRQGLRPE